MRRTIEYSKKLEEAGLTRKQAEVHLEILEEVVEDEMATKSDILSLKSEMHSQIHGFKSEMQNQMQEFRSEIQNQMQEFRSEIQSQMQSLRSEIKGEIQEMRSDIKQLELRMTIKLGLMQVATVGLLVAAIKLL